MVDEVLLSDREFSLFQSFLYQHAGIRLTASKHALVQNRLKKRLHKLGLTSYRAYYERVCKTGDDSELQQCLNALTTNETYFFRHKKHWDFLLQNIVPNWTRGAAKGATMRAWSAASSSGEEAYSLAIALQDALPPTSGYKVHVDATDINQEVLDLAEQGVYGSYALQKMTHRCLDRYFDHEQEGHARRVKGMIRNQVQFRLHNLMHPLRGQSYDVIFLRNVMIYFDDASKARVLSNVSDRLKRGGYLFLGGAETLSACQEQYEYVQPTIYRKRMP